MSEEQKKPVKRTRKAATKVNKPEPSKEKTQTVKPGRELIVHHHVKEG